MEFEKDNPDVLGSLYALRGGLSAISVERDKAQRADEECYEKLNNIAKRAGASYDTEDTVKYAEFICGDELEIKLRSDYKYKLDSIKEKWIEEKVIVDKQSSGYKKSSRQYHNEAIEKFIGMAFVLVLTAALLTMLIFLAPHPLMLLICIAPFTGAMVLMGKGIKSAKKEKYYKNERTNYLEGLERERDREAKRVIRERKWEAERVAAERKAVEEEYNKLFEQLPALREEAHAVLNERNATISPLVESCKVYHKALTEQFTPFLDERDWQHLDLVIYQLETRRADSIKEALQLVDRELQTERLENSIRAAIKSICFTLERGFTSLQDSIYANCSALSSRIGALSTEMSVRSNQLEDGLKSQLARLTDSVNVGNALQAKANESSAQLVHDVAALRYYNTDMYV